MTSAPRWHGWLKEIGWTLVAISAALFIRAFVAEPYRIPSTSMEPTLQVGDFVFVSKYIYGPRLPFKTEHALWENDVKRGDVVVFKREAENMPGSLFGFGSTFFIKRVVAVPGDRIAYYNKTLLLNGQPVPTQYLGDIRYPLADGTIKTAQRYSTTLPPQAAHEVLYDPYRSSPNLMEVEVPADQYVVIGDNRDNSHDSRFWRLEGVPEAVAGSPWRFVPRQDIIGRAEFVLFSVGPNWDFNWGRIGNKIQPARLP